MELGFNFSDVQASGGSSMPECKGYVFAIVNVDTSNSKAGKPMMRLDLDISQGEHTGYFSQHPKRLYIVYDDERGQARLKRTLLDIVSENPAMFPEEDPFANNAFDENRLIGCEVGGVLKWDGKWLEVNYITSKERALKVAPIPRPAQEDSMDALDKAFNVGGSTMAEKKSLFGNR